jgi:transglutaminase/protease-like cytokinesis protein 3
MKKQIKKSFKKIFKKQILMLFLFCFVGFLLLGMIEKFDVAGLMEEVIAVDEEEDRTIESLIRTTARGLDAEDTTADAQTSTEETDSVAVDDSFEEKAVEFTENQSSDKESATTSQAETFTETSADTSVKTSDDTSVKTSAETSTDTSVKTSAETSVKETAKTSGHTDTVTMMDRNLSYSCDDDGQTVEEYIAANTRTAAAMPTQYADIETKITALLKEDLDVYEIDGTVFDEDGGEWIEFLDYYTALHCAYGNEKGSFIYELVYKPEDPSTGSDGTYLDKIILYVNNTRSSIAAAKERWDTKIARREEVARLAADNRERIAQAVSNAGVVRGMSVREALIRINDYICRISTYDTSYTHRHFRDVLVSGTAVCNGYSELFMLMARYCGIDCDLVVGIGNGDSHDWNVVYFDNQTLYVDCTWNDNGTDRYLLVTEQELCQDHTILEYRTTLY